MIYCLSRSSSRLHTRLNTFAFPISSTTTTTTTYDSRSHIKRFFSDIHQQGVLLHHQDLMTVSTANPTLLSSADNPINSTEKDSHKMTAAEDKMLKNFLTEAIDRDLKEGGRSHGKMVNTRFPPEPNGYLHIGHAKSILLNFGLAKQYKGRCNMRFDDTNPATEETEYVENILEDVKWITTALDLPKEVDEKTGEVLPPWGKNLFFTSDYFDELFDMAKRLIKAGKAYVDSQTPEQVTANRGGGKDNAPGVNSPFRDRSPEENLKLFEEMQEGKHDEGTQLLRAKIDMQSPNMNLRDPPIYRIKKMAHHRSGDKWNVYPIYDFAHGQSDAIEHITHSICTLEFENHNVLYQWFVENIPDGPSKPWQFEFARLNLEGAMTSKRKLLRLVNEKAINGWDDPRVLTLCGLRRRGVRAEGIKRFCDQIGVTQTNSTQPQELLDDNILADLKGISHNRMVVLDPIRVEITSYKGEPETTQAVNHPGDSSAGTRDLSFSNAIYIEADDFQPEKAGTDFYRLTKVGDEIKLRFSYVLKLEEIVYKDAEKKVVECLKCSHDPATRDSMPKDRAIKGVVHWVDANNCIDVECRLIQELFTPEMDKEENKDKDFMQFVNPNSMLIKSAKAEKAILSEAELKDKKVSFTARYQFERKGYFAHDLDSTTEKVIFNRTVALKESAAAKKLGADGKPTKSRKDEQAAQAAEKERLLKVKPEDLFKQGEYEGLYSEYDAEGVPTKDAAGEKLTKSAIKKLKAARAKHEKMLSKAAVNRADNEVIQA